MRAIRAFLEFCYIARRNVIDTQSLGELEEALSRFHHYRTIFQDCGVRSDGFNLPRQHFLIHYMALIRALGAPNGLCSSITESKHIKAVKQPWRHSNRYKALGQMLLTNERLDKIATCRVDFTSRGMLNAASPGKSLYIWIHPGRLLTSSWSIIQVKMKMMMMEQMLLDHLSLLKWYWPKFQVRTFTFRIWSNLTCF